MPRAVPVESDKVLCGYLLGGKEKGHIMRMVPMTSAWCFWKGLCVCVCVRMCKVTGVASAPRNLWNVRDSSVCVPVVNKDREGGTVVLLVTCGREETFQEPPQRLLVLLMKFVDWNLVRRLCDQCLCDCSLYSGASLDLWKVMDLVTVNRRR